MARAFLLFPLILGISTASRGVLLGPARNGYAFQGLGLASQNPTLDQLTLRLQRLGLRAHASFTPPRKKKKRVDPAPLDEEYRDKSKDEEREMVDPENFRVTIEEDADGTKRIVPPKLSADLAELPEGWDVVYHEKTGEPYYYNSETGVATSSPPILRYEDKVALKKLEDDGPTEEQVRVATAQAEWERDRLIEERHELDRLIVFKRDVLENLEKELESLESRNEEITSKINLISTETPEERIERERRIEEEKRAARKKGQGFDPEELGVFGIEKERAGGDSGGRGGILGI